VASARISAASAGYAAVALPVPLDRAFTYVVPDGLTLAPGMRVLVPWSGRRLVGVVLEATAEAPPGVAEAKLRPIELALDSEPILDAPLLALARWTAAYYQAPLGEVLRCVLPPAPGVRDQQRLALTAAGHERLRAPAQTALFAPAAEGAPLLRAAQRGLSLAGALRRHGTRAVRQALAQGWLRLEAPAAAAAAEPVIRTYRLAAGATVPARAPAQAAALALLRAAGGEMDAATLRAQVAGAALAALRRRGAIAAGTRPAPPASPLWHPRPRITALNAEQRAALALILEHLPPEGAPAPILLHGVTGSGKTAVYLEAIAAALARERTALLLVPEIGLTPALFADFMDAFPEQVSILHSGLTPAERAQHWHRARRGQAAVVIGTRSAIFAPLPRLGLIIVDEEHDAAYKQQESPRYHARDLAVMRGRLSGATVLLGSATPSLESHENARAGKYLLARLRSRVESRPLPAVRMVDMCAEFRAQAAAAPRPGRGRGAPADALSRPLVAALGACLARGEQAVVLINRRGYAPAVVCRACGQPVTCRHCSLSLVYHKREGRLLCHACGFNLPVPKHCPACGSEHLYFLGAGSEKIEEALAGLFPRARIARLDRDTARERRHFARVLGDFREGKYDLLVGTQMIAKGHDLPGVTLVGVLQADWGLTLPEFRAAERTYQLLTQVAGRAGRGEAPGEVVLQLMHPEHYAVQAVLRGEPELFYEPEARYRRLLHYPPFAALALARIRHRDYEQALRWSADLGRFLEERRAAHADIRILGPAPAPVPRLKAEHRLQFLLKSARRRSLAALLGEIRRYAAERLPAAALTIDVDPQAAN